MNKLTNTLDSLPWIVRPANDKITSDHLLQKITMDLMDCDFAIFDISGWNPNVCLELGLARGLGIEYYIVNNNSKKKDAPSDIKGIERIDFNWNKKKKAADLFSQIRNGIFKKRFITKNIWNNIQHLQHAEKKFTLVLNILGSFKGFRKELSRPEIRKLGRGLNLREADLDEVIKSLVQLKLFKRIQRSGAIAPAKRLYRGVKIYH